MGGNDVQERFEDGRTAPIPIAIDQRVLSYSRSELKLTSPILEVKALSDRRARF